jgi:hypothetical protein
MITVVVGKSRNTTPWFSVVGETNRNRELHEPQPQIARTANRTKRNRKPHEPQPNRSVNLFLCSTVVTGRQLIIAYTKEWKSSCSFLLMITFSSPDIVGPPYVVAATGESEGTTICKTILPALLILLFKPPPLPSPPLPAHPHAS